MDLFDGAIVRLAVATVSFIAVSLSGCGTAGDTSTTSSQPVVSSLAPLLGDGSVADWWFAYKLNVDSFPWCVGNLTRECIFGGEVQDYPYGYSQQYLLASSVNGVTAEMTLKTDCLGTGDDPVAQTFNQIYSGSAANYVLWNDQFYADPNITLTPACSAYDSVAPTSCSAPWGHSKGAMAWDSAGVGFVMQVTTPDWPGSGDPTKPRNQQGNTLGCCGDDNVEVAQHFFALRLGSASDTKQVLLALQKASVVTDPSNSQLVKLSDGPEELKSLAESLAHLNTSTVPFQSTLSSGVRLIAKPQALNVPVWQLVSSLVGEPLRTATWWTSPAVPSAHAGTPGCWSSELGTPLEVQIATSGQWQGVNFTLTGGYGGNHAKLGHSIGGSLAIMGDMNQQGSYSPEMRKCNSSQNGRGGLFFVLDDAVLHAGLVEFMAGSTATYYDDLPTTTDGPAPSPSPTPSGDCGGAGVSSITCRTAASAAQGCVYVYSADEAACGVAQWGCYPRAGLPEGCPEAATTTGATTTTGFSMERAIV